MLGTPQQQDTADKLDAALNAAPELRQRPNLAVAAAQSADPVTTAQVLAHTSNMAALHQAASDVAQNKGGPTVLHRQLAAASSRYAKATGQSFWSKVGGGIDHAVGAVVGAAEGVPNLVEGVPGAVAGAAKGIGRYVTHTSPITGPVEAAKQGGPAPPSNPLLYAANAPLAEALHQYRYLHDVEARHGPAAAALAGLGMMAGAVGGAVATRSLSGATMGAELVEGAEARILYPESWHATDNGQTYRDPNTGAPVSPGRDVASLVSRPGTGTYNVLSGIGDAVGDMTLDPLARAGTLVGQARSLTGAKGLLGRSFSGTAVTADSIDKVYSQYPSVQNFFDWAANHSAADIAVRDPRFTPIAHEMAAAADANGVKEVVKGALRADQLTGGFRAPTLTLTHRGANAVVDRLKTWAATPVDFASDPTEILAGARQTSLVKRAVDTVLRSQERVADNWDPELLKYDSKSLDLMGNDAPKALYQFLRMGESEYTAKQTVQRFISSDNPGERMGIWHNALSDLLLARAAKVALHGRFSSAEGIFADPEVLGKLQTARAELSPEVSVGGTYGAGPLGHDISTVTSEDGQSFGAAITQNQTGRVSMPSLFRVKRAAQAIAGQSAYLGRVDDFLYSHITQAIFKRAVLLSGSFAQHIVAGEMILSTLRLGPLGMARSIVSDMAARLGIDLEDNPDEASIVAQQILAGEYVPRTRFAQGVARIDPEHFATAAALRLRRGLDSTSKFASPGIAAGHHFSAEVKSVETYRDLLNSVRSQAPSKRYTEAFGLFGHDPADEGRRWAAWLNEISRDPASREAAGAYHAAITGGATEADATAAGARAATAWLDAQPESYLKNYVRHRSMTPEGRDLGLTPHQDWGRVVMENVKGATTTANGEGLPDFVRRIAQTSDEADSPSFASDELGRRALADSPMAVKGRYVEHFVSGKLERFATWGHRKVLSPFINALSRDPTYIEEVTRQMKALQPLMDHGMGFDEAMNKAEERATEHTIRYVHNLNERTQFSEMMRNGAPFFFAQQQAYKRLFRMGAENPGALRLYQLGLQALANFGIQHTTGNGLQAVAFPGVGSATSGMLKAMSGLGLAPASPVPVKWMGSLSSANVIAPFSEGTGSFRPDLGPIVSIPLAAIHITFPELAHLGLSPQAVQEGQNVVGAIQGPLQANESTPLKVWSMFVPNAFVQRVMEGLDPSLLNTYYSSAAHQMIAALDYEQTTAMHQWIANGQKGPKPQIIPDAGIEKGGRLTPQQTQFLSRVVNGTRVLAMTKALVGLVTPLSPQLDFDKWGFTNEVRQDIQKHGLGEGLTRFLIAHPDASAFTVFSSDSEAGGAQIPATHKAMAFINEHQDFIARHPNSALYFLPPSAAQDPYSQAAYMQQLQMGLRTRRTNEQFLQAVYKASGDNMYYNIVRPMYDAAKVQNAHPGWSQAQAEEWAKDPKNAADLLAMKATPAQTAWLNTVINAMEQQNPTWGAQFGATSNTNRIVAGQALTDMRAAIKDHSAPQGPITDAVRTLIGYYDQYASSLPVGDSSYATTQQAAAQKSWREWLDEVRSANPDLSNVISSVFYNLGGTGGNQG